MLARSTFLDISVVKFPLKAHIVWAWSCPSKENPHFIVAFHRQQSRNTKSYSDYLTLNPIIVQHKGFR